MMPIKLAIFDDRNVASVSEQQLISASSNLLLFHLDFLQIEQLFRLIISQYCISI